MFPVMLVSHEAAVLQSCRRMTGQQTAVALNDSKQHNRMHICKQHICIYMESINTPDITQLCMW